MVRGDREKAIESYKRALAIDPTMESAKQAMRKLTGPRSELRVPGAIAVNLWCSL